MFNCYCVCDNGILFGFVCWKIKMVIEMCYVYVLCEVVVVINEFGDDIGYYDIDKC